MQGSAAGSASAGEGQGGQELAALRASELRLARLHRLSAVLAETNEAVIRATDLGELFRAAVRIAVHDGGFRMAWLGVVDASEHRVHPVAMDGEGVDYVAGLRISTDDVDRGAGPAGTAARTGEAVVANDIANEPSMVPWRDEALRRGFRASAAFPLRVDGEVVGVLSVYADEAHLFDSDEAAIIERLAANLAFGWESLRREEQPRASELALLESAERLRHGFEEAVVGTALVGLDGHLLEVNAALAALLGRTPDELVGIDVETLVHPDDRVARRRSRRAALSGSAPTYQEERRYLRPDGSLVWTITSSSLVRDAAGQPSYFFSQFLDITARKEGEQAAQTQAAQQAAVAALSRQALTELDLDGLLDQAVEALVRLLGVPLAAVLALEPPGQSLRMRAGIGWRPGLVGVLDLPSASASILGTALRTAGPVVGSATPSSPATAAPAAGDVLDAHGARAGIATKIDAGSIPFGVLVAFATEDRAFTEMDQHFVEAVANVLGSAVARRRTEDRLREQALHDPLTGLPNRTLLHDRLDLALARVGTRSSGVGVVLADLDHFKVVNDSLGHATGDRLLVAVSERLAQLVRPTDTIARVGGDEFAIVCEDVPNEVRAIDVARQLGAALDTPFHVAGHELFSTASVGITFVGEPGADVTSVLRDAEVAMYQAKADRSGLAVFEPTMRAAAVRRLEVESALRQALERGELRLHFQPVVDLATGRIRAAEALVRWEHPVHGLVGPDEFVPLAEATGLIVPLGRWVLREACQAAARWERDHPAVAVGVAANLSVRELREPDLLDQVAATLRESGLAPGRLALEITESVLASATGPAVATIQALKATGVGVSIDDFGTGHSSLAYLKQFPVDLLKIDRTFVAGVDDDDKDRAIVVATVNLARSLGLRTVAEGVETATQLAAVRALGCDGVQGYLVSPPVPEAELVALLEAERTW